MTKRFPKKRSKAQAKRNVKKKMTVTSTEPTSADDRESEPQDLGDVADGNSEDASDLGVSIKQLCEPLCQCSANPDPWATFDPWMVFSWTV